MLPLHELRVNNVVIVRGADVAVDAGALPVLGHSVAGTHMCRRILVLRRALQL